MTAARSDRPKVETVIRYTTAPEAYDGFGTRTLYNRCGFDNGKPVRRVEIQVPHLEWQEQRYGSGMHVSLSEDGFERLKKCPWYYE